MRVRRMSTQIYHHTCPRYISCGTIVCEGGVLPREIADVLESVRESCAVVRVGPGLGLRGEEQVEDSARLVAVHKCVRLPRHGKVVQQLLLSSPSQTLACCLSGTNAPVPFQVVSR